MNILESFRSAIFNILSNKMKTILTTLGIIIGITSVVIITAIGKGYQIQADAIFEGIDKESVSISTSWEETIRDKDKLTLDDVEKIKQINNVKYASASHNLNVNVELKNPKETKGVQLAGTSVDTKEIEKIEILYGRFLNDKDLQFNNKVCIIDNKLAVDIFGREDVIGEDITVNFNKSSINLTVIGISKLSNNNLFSSTTIYSPIGTVMDFAGISTKTVDGISAKLNDISQFKKTEKEILKVLAASHSNDPKKYSVTGNFQFSDYSAGVIQIVTLFISFVAGISLLVGGIGVMNIMLVTVTERTREIGIRKSLGATNNDIKLLFLIESMTISLFGGIIGVIFGYLGSYIVMLFLKALGNNLVPVVSLQVVFVVFIISSLIGIIFGVYPAGKAAKLDPIEALRYE